MNCKKMSKDVTLTFVYKYTAPDTPIHSEYAGEIPYTVRTPSLRKSDGARCGRIWRHLAAVCDAAP